MQIFTYFVIIWKKFTLQWGRGSKFHEYKKGRKFVFSCLLTFVVTNVCVLKHSVDRNIQESCKTHKKCLNICRVKYCNENFQEVPVQHFFLCNISLPYILYK